jgi:hypothetical protein
VKITIAEHPRAVRGVRRVRAIAGLAGFLVAALLAHKAALPAADVLSRALIAGIGAHVAGWFFALVYWRAAIHAELEVVRRHHLQARQKADDVLRDTAQAASPLG